MLEKWIESVFIKRVVLAIVATVVAHGTANSLPGLSHLSAIGVNVTVTVDQAVFTNWLTIILTGLSQGFHEWAAVKWPELGKYI